VAYQIEISKRVRKQVARLPRRDQARVLAVVRALAKDSRPTGCRPVKMAGKGAYRVRVGDYRVIYAVLDDERVVIIAQVTRRSESTYQGLG
jgi:mRNA interferase RelE/StbE